MDKLIVHPIIEAQFNIGVADWLYLTPSHPSKSVLITSNRRRNHARELRAVRLYIQRPREHTQGKECHIWCPNENEDRSEGFVRQHFKSEREPHRYRVQAKRPDAACRGQKHCQRSLPPVQPETKDPTTSYQSTRSNNHRSP